MEVDAHRDARRKTIQQAAGEGGSAADRFQPTPEEGKLLELLGILIEDYDDRKYPLGASDPAGVLAELMEAHGLTQKDLWPVFGSKGTASEVLNRKRGISKAHAKKLAEFFHVSAVLFL